MTRSPDREDSILVHAYLDGELDPANTLAIERRMAAEPALLAEYRRLTGQDGSPIFTDLNVAPSASTSRSWRARVTITRESAEQTCPVRKQQ